MDNKIISDVTKALGLIAEGVSVIQCVLKDLLNDEDSVSAPQAVLKKHEETESSQDADKNWSDNTDEDKPVSEGKYSEEYLNGLKFNDLKKLGASLGIKCTGTRNEIIDKILTLSNDGSMEEGNAGNVVNMPVPENPGRSNTPAKRSLSKKAAEGENEIEQVYIEQAGILLDEYDVDEIIDVLKESGVKVSASDKKDRSKLFLVLAKAIKEGYVEVEEDNDAEDAENIPGNNQEQKELAFDEDSYFPEYDPEGYNDPSKMTEAREKAVKEVTGNLINARNSGELTNDAMTDELSDFDGLEGDVSGNDELFARYIELQKRFISDDGEEMNPGDAYEINGNYFCCGSPLIYSKKQKNYTCAICGETYEA